MAQKKKGKRPPIFMEDPECSSSFAMDAEENMNESADQENVSELALENQRLKDLNTNLQQSLDTLKVQLKDALAAIDTSKGVNEQIISLRTQLDEATQKRDSLAKELKALSASTEAQITQLTADNKALTAENTETSTKLAAAEEHVAKLRRERQNLRDDVEEKEQLLESVSDDISKLKQQKKKANQKFIAVAEKLQVAEAANEQLNLAVQDLQNEKMTLTQDNDSLKLKLQTAASFNDESETTLNALAKEMDNKQKSIDALENQVSSQREEIEELNEERQKILNLLQSLHRSIGFSENAIETLQKENASLKAKVKAAAKPAAKAFGTQQEFLALQVPFEGELKEKCEATMRMPQYQPLQRIQLVFNDLAKVIADLTEAYEKASRDYEVTKAQLDNFTTDQVRYQEILDSLLCDMKNLATNQEIINGSTLCQSDPVFLDFMEKKMNEITPIVQREAIKDPKYIPTDFFITTDVTRRKEAIRKLLQPTDSTFALFTAQFLTNVFLLNQLASVTEPLKQLDEITKNGDLKGTKINDIPKVITQMQEKIQHLKASQRQLHGALKKTQAQQLTIVKSDNENKTKLSELQLQNETLKNDIEVLKVKLQVANNELLLKTNECGNLANFADQIREGVEEHKADQRARCDKLEAALANKTRECSQLSELIKHLQESLDMSNAANEKRIRKNEEALLAQIENLQQQLDAAEVRRLEKKKAAKRSEKSLREQYENSIKELTAKHNEARASQEATIATLKEKCNQSREMSKKLVASMSEVEKRSQAVQEENATLVQNQKALQLQLAQMRQTVQKEKQAQQAQLSAQMMAIESRAQKQTTDVRNELEAKRAEILSAAQETLGAFYGIDEADFDEEMFKQTVEHAREDLEKLQYFQAEATRPYAPHQE